MSLEGVRDEFLSRRVREGDDVAFAELARRYRPLIDATTRRRPEGLDADDARQAALIGLFEACRETDGASGRFAGIARLRVGWKVAAVRRAASAHKQRILTEATNDCDGRDGVLARVPAPESADPARVVELREALRERLREREDSARRRACSPAGDLRRRYGDEQIARAIAMVADGSTVAAAAAAVDARYGAVRAWLSGPRDRALDGGQLAGRRARAPGGDLRRSFSDEQVDRAVAMVANGSTITAAAAAVGASHPTVLRWLHKAA